MSMSSVVARLRRLPLRGVALVPFLSLLAVPGSLLVPATLFFGRGASAPPPVASSPGAQLVRALAEADRNCEAAREPATCRLTTVELEAALLENPWVTDRALGEVDTLLDEAAWLSSLAPGAQLGERSWEDVRFLLGGIRWYLARALEAGERSQAALRARPELGDADAPVTVAPSHEEYDRGALRAYRDVSTFEELLGQWD